MRKILYNILYYSLLLGFTVFFLLNTFVLEQVEQTDALEIREEKVVEEKIVRDDYYKDENIEITLKTDRKYDTDIYVADVKLSTSEYLRTAFAKNTFGRNVKDDTSVIAAENHAILAINGDYYGAREAGYVVREYKTFRKTSSGNREDLVMYPDGSFEIIKENKTKLDAIDSPRNVWTFGPGLVKSGEINVTYNQEVSSGHRVSNPRTAICYIDVDHYAFVVSDGRTKKSEGLSLYELANYMKDLGCSTAYNLDGGGSSTMVFNGKIINNPTHTGTKITEREVSDIVYIGY